MRTYSPNFPGRLAPFWPGLMTLLLINGLLPINAAAHAMPSPQSLPAVQQIVIKFKNTQPDLNLKDELTRISQRASVSLAYVRPMSGDAHVVRLPAAVPLTQATHMAQSIALHPDVAYAVPDALAQPHGAPALLIADAAEGAPNDFYYAKQWNLKAVDANTGVYGLNAEAAWAITTGDPNLVIAVIDTGVLTTHSDLAGRLLPGYDFISSATIANDGDGRDGDASDPGDWVKANDCGEGMPAHNSTWHGTLVVGPLAATSNNTIGVAGINWQSKVVPVRALGRCGGTGSDIADAIRWSAGLVVPNVPTNPHPARIINLSLGTLLPCSALYQEAIDEVNQVGAIVVVSAGNEGVDVAQSQPANCNDVVRVAATTRAGARASYSNSGSLVTIAAPGGEIAEGEAGAIFSIGNAGKQGPEKHAYALGQGTSVAAPQIAGLISLMLSVKPTLTRSQVMALLQRHVSVFPTNAPCTPTTCGPGLANAGAAVQAAKVFVAVTPTTFIFLPVTMR